MNGGPPDLIDDVARAALALRRASAHLDETVARARAGGKSRGAIGRALGMSRQAACERWGKPASPVR